MASWVARLILFLIKAELRVASTSALAKYEICDQTGEDAVRRFKSSVVRHR